jgi:hypothetical protein
MSHREAEAGSINYGRGGSCLELCGRPTVKMRRRPTGLGFPVAHPFFQRQSFHAPRSAIRLDCRERDGVDDVVHQGAARQVVHRLA